MRQDSHARRAEHTLRILLASILLVSVVTLLLAAAPQTEHTAEYVPVRFTTPEGDTLYFGRVGFMAAYADRYLVISDYHDYSHYLLDTLKRVGRRIGGVGDGPGEYRRSLGFGIRGDSLYVSHEARVRCSVFELPDLEYVRTLSVRGFIPSTQLWETTGTFLSTELPRAHATEGLFGRFSEDGVLLQTFGDFDAMERFESDKDLQVIMNHGYLALTPNRDVVFAYGYRPILLTFEDDGSQVSSKTLEMPWNTPGIERPVRSQSANQWIARMLFVSLEVTDTGFLLGARGYKGRDSIPQMYLALYDWQGDLLEYISLPRRHELRTSEDYLTHALKLAGDYWVAVDGDPAIRRLVVR